MASSTTASRASLLARRHRLRENIPYYASQVRAWQGDDANSRRNVAEFTRRLEDAQIELTIVNDAILAERTARRG